MTKQYRASHRFMQRVVALKPVSWFLARTQHHFDRAVFKLSNGRYSMAGLITGLPMISLTTIGAKSGQPRTVPLVAIPYPDQPQTLFLIASNWAQAKNPGWYYNLKANSQATVLFAGQSRPYRAHEAEGAEYDRLWQTAVAIYAGYGAYKERAGDRHIPIMVLAPISENAA